MVIFNTAIIIADMYDKLLYYDLPLHLTCETPLKQECLKNYSKDMLKLTFGDKIS